MARSTHIAVLGGGPAGAAAAFHLARAGVAVTLLEARSFPRVKVCGEYISPAATALLESIVPSRELTAAGARRITRIILDAGDRRATWPQPQAAWSLSRATLDPLLLDKARGVGARILQPATARRVSYSDTHATIELADGRTIACDIVVHADGSGRHDPAGPAPVVPSLIAHKCHLRIPGDDPDAVTMRSCPGAYIGTMGVEHGLFTCALVTRRGFSKHFRDPDALTRSLWPEFRPEWRTTVWKTSGVPRSRYIGPGHPRSFRLGNAAAAVDPVGGEGIGLALWSAAQLACYSPDLFALADSPTAFQMSTLQGVQRRFEHAYAAQLRTRLPACQLTAWTLMHPALVRALWPMALVPGLSFGPFYRMTGKSAHASP